ncbi:MAG: hypothetical protein AB8V46_04815 [Candidatus Midichloria sp.]
MYAGVLAERLAPTTTTSTTTTTTLTITITSTTTKSTTAIAGEEIKIVVLAVAPI